MAWSLFSLIIVFVVCVTSASHHVGYSISFHCCTPSCLGEGTAVDECKGINMYFPVG